MVGMTYWRKGGEEPPRRVDETGGEGVARQICRGFTKLLHDLHVLHG